MKIKTTDLENTIVLKDVQNGMKRVMVTDLENTVVMRDVQNDMKQVMVNGNKFAIAIKTNDGIILDHVKTSSSDDDTVFPNKPNGQVVKTWRGAADFVLEFVQNN